MYFWTSLHILFLKNCEFIITDSGGVQEEAPSFGKYVYVMREFTERMESIDKGYSELLPTSCEIIYNRICENKNHNIRMVNPYGDGYTTETIKNILVNIYKVL